MALSHFNKHGLVLCAVTLLVLSTVVRAGESGDPVVAEGASGEDAAGEPTPSQADPAAVETAAAEAAESETAGGEEPVNPCWAAALSANPGNISWLDSMQHGIFMSVCTSAKWFDGFFGDARFDNEAERTWGRLAVDTIWDQKDSVEAKVRFRAQVSLPNVDNRVNAFLGRENESDFVSGRNENFESLPEFFRDSDEREWLVGLGYRPVGNFVDRVDFSAGVKLRFPLEPFVQGRYRHNWFFAEDRLVRFRNTVFWRNQRGFGNTISLDFEKVFGARFLGRAASSATFSETTEGIDWYTSLTLYQSLGSGLRALSWTAYLDGETDHAVPVERYGLRAIYRQQMLRKWFFGQLITGVSWPRDPGEDREMSWELGVGFEVQYGQQP